MDQVDSVAAAPIYARLADELCSLIGNGQLRPGERLPSVRRLSQQKRVSATTAIAALRDLETRGLVEARPQSGYFVKARLAPTPEPAMTRPPAAAKTVGIDNLMVRMIDAGLNRDLAPLGTAAPDPAWFPVQRLQRAIASTARRHPELLVTCSPYYAGLESLRHQVARHYAALGCAVAQDEVVITNGCTEALNLALSVVAAPGDTIAIESPGYYGFLQIIEKRGLKALELATHPRDGLSVDALEQALASRAGRSVKACLVSPSFSNPMGASMPEAQKRRLVALCAQHGVALIEDDVYADLQHFGPRPVPAKAWDRDGNVMLCSSFTKTLAPGTRVGWVFGGRHAEEIRLRKFAASGASPAILQQALAEVLRTGGYERHLLKLRRGYADQVARMTAAVCGYFPAGTRITQPGGGFVVWVELPGKIDTLALYDKAIAQGVNFAPGPLFSASGRYGNFLRLNCGRMWTPLIERALERLGRLVHAELAAAPVAVLEPA
jgi:DNA-binding transcriptional MocR family regulator